jgi:hypothetical protein
MKIKIQGTEYEMASIGKATLFDVMEIKKQTGMTIGEVEEHLTGVANSGDDETNGAALLSNPEALVALGALIWLTRRRAGEVLTLEQACDFPLDEMEFITEDGDETPVGDSGK